MSMSKVSCRQFVIAALLLPLLSLSGCRVPATTSAASDPTAPRPLKVVATFLPVYLFTKAVAGDAADVEILIPPGTEVHEYQSKPRDVQAIAQADVVVKNGLGLETFLDSTIESAGNPRLRLIDASSGIQPIQALSPVVTPAGSPSDATDHPDHEDETGHGSTDSGSTAPTGSAAAHTHAEGNPHVWLDPVLAKQQVETIRDGLIAADPKHQSIYQANAAAYIEQLNRLHASFEQRLKGYRDRTFVTFHDAFPYLAKRYDLNQVAVVALPDDQLSPADVQQAVSTVKQYQVKALFGERGTDNKLLSSLSQDLNLTLRSLDSLESGTLDPQYYFTAMQTNLQTLEAAFQ